MELLLFVAIGPLLILIGVNYLARYLLKRKLKPNEVYLEKINEVKVIKRLSFVNSIIVFLVIITQKFKAITTLLLISMVIVELICNKYALSYLKTKNESTSTRKYILSDLCFQFILLIVVLCLYFYFLIYKG